MKPAAAILLMTLMTASACREVPPETYVELTGRIFVFNYRVARATYVITLGKLRPIPDGSVVETRFDNPRGGDPLTQTEKIWPKLDKISIESPPVFCIVKDRPYKFSVVIKDAAGAVLQQLDGAVISSLDQTVLPDIPLVVGHAYEPNPDLVGHPDGKNPEKAAVKCDK
jgi:hypothetical protein